MGQISHTAVNEAMLIALS